MTSRRILTLSIALFAAICSFSALGDDPPKKVDGDDEERRFQAFETRRLLEENCLICHSGEIMSHQRLTPKQWSAEVDKMIAWGSPLPAGEASRLAQFLSEQYPTAGSPPVIERKTIENELRTVAISPNSGNPDRGGALFATYCANCHAPDARGAELGPNLVEKPSLLRAEEFSEVVLKGRRRMPASESVLKPEQVEDILAWLRVRR